MEEIILFGLSFFLLGMIVAYWAFLYPIDHSSEEINDAIRNIDDNYYEAFTLVQKELEEVMEDYKENDTYKDIPAQRIYEVICATDMFRNQIYKRYEGADRKELDDTASES